MKKLKGGPTIPPLVAGLERFKRECSWAETTREGMAIIRVIQPKAERLAAKAMKRYERRKPEEDPKKQKRKEKAITTQKIKQEIKSELSKLSHEVCFKLGGVDYATRTGHCFTCGKFSTLQWGHFIPQRGNPRLVYHPHNTRPQCVECNLTKNGNYEAFRANLEREFAGRAAGLESLSKALKGTSWRISSLVYEWENLCRFAERIGITPPEKNFKKYLTNN